MSTVVSPATYLREAAEALLGRSLTSDECAEWICIAPRSWRKYEEALGPPMRDSQVKLFCYEVGLRALERAEQAGTLEELLGGPATVGAVFDYLDDLFAEHDPLTDAQSRPPRRS